jgi:hypothetical protein
MIRLNTPIESLVINLQSAGNVQYNIQYVIVRQGTRLEKSTEGLLTSSGQNVVLINDFSSGYFDITYINVTNIDPTENFISVLKKTNVSEFNLTSEAIGLKNRECTEFTSESGFKVLDQNGSFKTITESVSADGDVENSDMSYMASVPSGGTLTLPDSDIEVNGVGEGVVVSVKTISVDLNDGTDPVSPTLVTLVGNTLTITLPDIGDVTVENSDATYQVIEPSGGTLVLPDSQINFNGVDQGDVVSVKTINVDLTDGVDPVVPTSVGLVGNTLTITLASSGDVDIEINGVPFDTIAAPATVDIPVINTVPIPVGTITGTDVIVGDSSAVIKNSAGTTIKTEAIPAEVVENITINDSTAVIKDSIGTTLKSEPILAEASENITINNSTVNIRDTAATLLHSVSVRAEATTTQDIADTSVENSDASYSVNVLAEGSLILPDSQINVNGVDEGDVVSVKTIDVNLEDSLGDPVTPTSIGLVGNTLTIEVPSGSSSFDLDLVDRFGNAFPTKQVTANATWDLRTLTPYDWADLYINSLDFTPSTTESDGIIDFYVDMQSAGILEKRYAIYIYFGSSAVNCKWNLKYPFNNDSSQVLTFESGSVYDADGFQGTALTKTNPYTLNMLQGGNMAFFSKNNVATNNSFQLQATADSRLFSLQIDSPNNATFIRAAHATTAQSSASAPANRSGLWHVNHDTSRIKIRHQGTNYINSVVSMIDFPSGGTYKDFFIKEFSTARCQYTAFGGSLTESEMDTETTLVTALNTALGR